MTRPAAVSLLALAALLLGHARASGQEPRPGAAQRHDVPAEREHYALRAGLQNCRLRFERASEKNARSTGHAVRIAHLLVNGEPR